MDLSTVIPDLLKLSPLVALLVIIAYLLWKRNQSLVRESKAHYSELIKRIESDTVSCRENYKQAVERIQHLEKRTYEDGRDDKAALVQCVDRSARALEKFADLEAAREESSLHFALKDRPARRRRSKRETAPMEALDRK